MVDESIPDKNKELIEQTLKAIQAFIDGRLQEGTHRANPISEIICASVDYQDKSIVRMPRLKSKLVK